MLKRITFLTNLMFKNARTHSIIKILLMLISAVAAALSVYVMQRLVETIEKAFQGSAGIRNVVWWLLIFTLLNLWEIVQRHVNNLLQISLSRKLKENLLPLMADKAANIAYDHFEKAESKDIFFRLEKSPHEVVLSVFDMVLDMLQNILSLLGIILVFASASLWFPVIFIVILVPVILFDYSSTMTVRRMRQNQTFADRELSYYDSLLFSKYELHELKMMNSVDYIQNVWNGKAQKVLDEYMSATLKAQLLQFGSTLLLFGFTAVAMGHMIYNVYYQKISVGVFVSLVNAVQSVHSLEYDLAWALTKFSQSVGRMEYFERFLAIPDEKRGEKSLSNQEYEIAFDHVSFSYPGTEKQVLSDLSFVIRPGEKVCIVGQNGAGKSTIIKLLCGLFYTDSGEIKINGVDIQELSEQQMKKVRSVVFQDYFKFYSTIRENVAYSDLNKLSDDHAIMDALQHTQADFMESFDQKLDTTLGNLEDDAVDLSGGQWQKLAIARACHCKSSFLIMDEPTAALDPIAESRMYHIFSEVLRNQGYIFISHRLASAKMAERILVMESGTIVEDGNHEELMKQQGLYYRMFSEQSAWYTNEGMVGV